MAKLQFLSLAALAILVSACGGKNYNDEIVLDEKYVHRYGVTVPPEFWASSGEHGSVISTMADGVVVTKFYTAGTLDGDVTYTYPHSSQIHKSQKYQMGTLVKEIEYFYDGTPKCQIAYHTPNAGMQSITTWYLTGCPKSVECYEGTLLIKGDYYTSNNQRDAYVEQGHGTRLVRDDYGKLTSSEKFENGLIALSQTYHANGLPKEIIPFKNGKIDGVKRTYHPEGEPDTIEQWVLGKQEGMSLVYQYGEKYAEVPYFNGEKHGVECRFRDGNVKVQEISWHTGQMHGPSTTYIGDTTKTDWYYWGKSVSKADYEFATNRPIVH